MSEQKIEEFYRDATADDVAEIVKTGKTREARFRDNDISDWVSLSLTGFRRESGYDWLDCNYVGWRFCQVYDPPEWFINKPDPGEGWRLLEKFPPEELQKGDQRMGKAKRNGEWIALVDGFDPGQKDEVWYRRRIANSPTSSDGCRSRDTIPSGWRVLGKDEERLTSDAYWAQCCDEWILLGDDRVKYANDKSGKWHAIRRVEDQVDYALVDGYIYYLSNGLKIRITAKGFELW